MSDADLAWMRRALELAERGRGHVEPNPLVGAVIVRDNQEIGAGWHQRYGGPHAEVNALAAAAAATAGATLYVTLEPCCHHGKTPPCTDAILRGGIRRVVAAMPDPFPAVAGQGLGRLREASVSVEVGLCQAEAAQLNAPYLKLLSTGRPWVHVKWAMTLDGKIATRMGDSRWISNEESRRIVHTLRGRMDAVLVGIGTALADDPQLTARPAGPRTPSRVVLDSSVRLPHTSRLAMTATEVPTVLACSNVVEERASLLRQQGCEVLALPPGPGGVDIGALLDELGRRRMTNMLVEGGAGVLGSFLDAGAIDEVHVFIAPRLAGGALALTPMGGRGVERIAQAVPLSRWQLQDVGGDLYVHGWR